jgi:hypothetical protein
LIPTGPSLWGRLGLRRFEPRFQGGTGSGPWDPGEVGGAAARDCRGGLGIWGLRRPGMVPEARVDGSPAGGHLGCR